MNKYRYILGICLLLIAAYSHSQVVINNKDNNTSGGTFHVDGAGDNDAVPTATQIENDVFVDSDGKLGIGTITPDKKLHIEVNATSTIPLRIADGSQAAGRVLTSDADGYGRWQNFGAIPVRNVLLGAAKQFKIADVTGKYLYSNTSVTLPPGLWLVEVNVLVYRSGGSATSDFAPKIWLKTIISDTKTATAGPTSDSYGPGSSGRMACDYVYAKGPGLNMINGYFIINNNSEKNKTYYYMFGYASVFGGTIPADSTFSFGGDNESTIFATYIDEARP
ncbi:hypothetical protein LJC00_03685 [Dysgonomonas sp. OttesenSCG-928-M03]|nr:hypothetical protein [Dysgonomonas sp. OttesenSCG-928-M03]